MSSKYEIVEKLLTQVEGAFPEEASYKWREALPIIGQLPASSGLFAVEGAVNFMGDVNAQGGVAPLETLPVVDVVPATSGSYSCTKYGFSHPIAEEDIKNESDGMPIVEKAAKVIKRTVWTQLEAQVAALTISKGTTPFGTATLANFKIANPLANGTSWQTVGSDPVTDLLIQMDAVRILGNGVVPDTLHLDYDAARAMTLNANVRGYLTDGVVAAGTGSRQLTFGQLESVLNDVLFGGKGKVVIFEGMYNSANHAKAVVGANFGTSGSAWMGRTLNADPIFKGGKVEVSPVAAATFLWEDFSTGLDEMRHGIGMDAYGKINAGIQMTDVNLGYLVSDLLA